MRTSQRNLVLSVLVALLFTFAVPSSSLAQGRGNGNRRGRNVDWSDYNGNRSNRHWRRHYNKKCGKFVNCHDARDGRWDGRGARGSRAGNYVWRDGRRVRVYNAYNNNFRYDRNRRYYRRASSNR